MYTANIADTVMFRTLGKYGRRRPRAGTSTAAADGPPDAHLDALMTTIVDRYGMESVRTVIHRVLVDGMPFRTATHDLELSNVDGVRIGTTAGQFLDELNTQDDG